MGTERCGIVSNVCKQDKECKVLAPNAAVVSLIQKLWLTLCVALCTPCSFWIEQSDVLSDEVVLVARAEPSICNHNFAGESRVRRMVHCTHRRTCAGKKGVSGFPLIGKCTLFGTVGLPLKEPPSIAI